MTSQRAPQAPAAPVRRHLYRLAATGAGWARIATLAGTSRQTLLRCRHPGTDSIDASIARRLYALTPETVAATDQTPTALEHIRVLTRQGLSLQAIANAAGIGKSSAARYAAAALHDTQAVHLQPEVAAAILAIPTPSPQVAPHAATDRLIDSQSTVRRLQALMAQGFSQQSIAAFAGAQRFSIQDALKAARVRTSFAARITTAYRQLAFTAPVYPNARARVAGERARALSRAKGWLGPLDWADIDQGIAAADGATAPFVDELAIDRACAGQTAISLTAEEQAIAAARLSASGAAVSTISVRLGVPRRAVSGLLDVAERVSERVERTAA